MPAHPSTPADRVVWIGRLLADEGAYGVVTDLGRQIGASRQTLTAWRERGRAALVEAAEPPRTTPLLERGILTLLVVGHASYRGIQACLAELLGWDVSLGTIAGVVAEAGERAAALLGATSSPAPVVLAVDEIFGGAARHGYLSAVDARSGAVWAATGPVISDAAGWRQVLDGLAAQGVNWIGAVHDGGRAAASGAAAAAPDTPRQRDIWHALHRCAQAQTRIDRLVAQAEAKWETAERYAAMVAAGGRPRYRPPTASAAVQAVAVDAVAETAAALRWLTGELRRVLGVVVVEHGRLLDATTRRAEVATVLALLEEFVPTAPAAAQPELTALHRHLAEASAGLLSFADALDPIQHDLAPILGRPGVALVGWAWERRAILGTGDALLVQLPPSWRPAARLLLTAWTGTVRASSAAEGWHSLVRPHLAVHRSLSPALLAVLAVWHNHRVFARGAHAGQSPLHRSGLIDAPTDWLAALGYAAPTVAPTPVRATTPEIRMAA